MTDLYRLVYTSHNLLTGTDAERIASVSKILAASQRNNAKVGVTGALLFNGGSFAQVLEGSRSSVEATFERIQRDTRHSDVSVLQLEPVAARGFPNWSMAFVGQSARGRDLWDKIAGHTGFDLARIEGDKLFATLQSIVIEEEGLTVHDPAPAPVAASAGPRRHDALDVERLRSELGDRLKAERPLAAPSSVPVDGPVSRTTPLSGPADPLDAPAGQGRELAILRAALAEERERTTVLRGALDEAHIALAVAVDRADTLLRHHAVWAERARALVAAFCLTSPEETVASTPPPAEPVPYRASSSGKKVA